MGEQAVLRSPQIVANELDVSLATLRRWSDEFKDFLSDEANGAATGRSQRRYYRDDVLVLRTVKEMMNDGLTYDQVRQNLKEGVTVSVEPDDILSEADVEADEPLPDLDDFDDDEGGDDPAAALVAANGAESPAFAFLNNTLATLSDSQKSILNSQAANRELLGVLLQDNFNLKEENNRLRERILEVEREVSLVRQDEEWRREALRQEIDAKLAAVNQVANEAMQTASSIEVPEIRTIEKEAPGCLGMFLPGSTQVVTTPRRRKSDGGKGPVKGAPPPTPAVGASPGSGANHPKPMFPPE